MPDDLLGSKAPTVQAPEPALQQTPASPPVFRRFGDYGATRDNLFSNSLEAVKGLAPVENTRYKLDVSDVRYGKQPRFSLADQKAAMMDGRTLSHRIIGNVRLTDKATGTVTDNRPMTLAAIPYLTDNGTFVMDGSLAAVSHQSRLDPGVFTRRKSNGAVESHVNVMPGGGTPHRIHLDPQTGAFKVSVGQAELPAATLIKILGGTEEEMKHAWGDDLARINLRNDKPHHVDKYYEKFGPSGPVPESQDDKVAAIATRLKTLKFDPWINKRTLGTAHATYGKDVVMAITKKLLDVANGRAEPDDRDHPAYSSVWGPEHLIPERLARSRGTWSKLLWQATNTGSLKGVAPGFLTPTVRAFFTKSGLSQSPEGSSAAEFMDHGARLTKVGEGGIGRSSDSVPASSRWVSSGQVPFIDLVRTSESGSVGVDLRTAFGTKLGSDKRIYAPLALPSGRIVYRSPRDLADSVVAFPGWRANTDPMIPVIKGGKSGYAKRDQVDYFVPSMEQTFSPMTNLVPMKSASKPHRSSMGARYITQSLPLLGAEAPLVRTGVPGQPGKSFEELLGRHMGVVAARPDSGGVVKALTPDGITVKYDDGKEETHDLYNAAPTGRKVGLQSYPLVQPGQRFEPGQVLSHSNFTDPKGHAAYGTNARVGFMAHPSVYEDSVVVSRSLADRMTSHHILKHQVTPDDDTTIGRTIHAAAFPGKHPLETLKTVGEDGVVKPGTIVNSGDPLVLAVRKRAAEYGRLSRSAKVAMTDASELWEHDEPGKVVDVKHTPNGPVVLVETYKPMKNGDKLSGRHGNKGVVRIESDSEMPIAADGKPLDVILSSLGTISRCYDEETEFLTERGWLRGGAVTGADRFLAFDPETKDVTISAQTAPFHVQDYDGPMYYFKAEHMDLAVTPGHKFWARNETSSISGFPWKVRTVEQIAFKRYVVPVTGNVVDGTDEDFVLPEYAFGVRHQRLNNRIVINARDWAAFLGWYMSEGNCDPAYGKSHISQSDTANPAKCTLIAALLDRLPFGYSYASSDKQFHIYSKRLAVYLKQFGLSHEKFIPDWVFRQSRDTRQAYLDAAWAGDGSITETATGVMSSLPSTSKRLVDDTQRLMMYQGFASIVRPLAEDKRYRETAKPMWRLGVMLKMRERSLADRRHATGGWEIRNYTGKVYCPSVPTGFVIVRRNGKPLVAGNTNPSAIFEAALGKIAAKNNNTPYVVHDFEDHQNVGKYVEDELAKSGTKFLENLTDPKTGRTIKDVGVGNLYLMKLSHMAESKAKGRGLGGYDESGQPTRGSENGAMRSSLGDTMSLLSYGATNVLRDAHMHKGQANPAFWTAYMAGFPVPHAATSSTWNHFLTELRASGVDPVRENNRYRLMGLKKETIDQLAGDRVVRNGETLDFSKDNRAYKGGLHDEDIFGATDSKTQWAKIPLHEPIINPVFEEPARRLLGLTEAQFRDTIAGKHKIIGDRTGMSGIVDALKSYDVPTQLAQTRKDVESARKTVRDAAVRKLGYLKHMDQMKSSPADWVWTDVPVMPPAFRPVTPGRSGGAALVHDMNYVLRELIEANEAHKGLAKVAEDVGPERLNVYDAAKAVAGLGDPITAKNRERGVKGVLSKLLGESSKQSYVQQKLLGTPVDLSGRGQVLPSPDLHIDQIGIPESVAWQMYHPFVVRRMVRNGVPRVEAAVHARDKTELAKRALSDEMDERPVTATRYPVLHRYGMFGFKPKLTSGDAILMNNLVTKPLGMDFDGDQQFNSVVVALDLCDLERTIHQRTTSFWDVRDMTARFKAAVPCADTDRARYFCVNLQDFPHGKKLGETDGANGLIEFYEVDPAIKVIAYDETKKTPVLAPVSVWSVHHARKVETVELLSGRQIVSDDDPRAVYGIDPETLQFMRSRPSAAAGLMVPRVDRFDSSGGRERIAFLCENGEAVDIQLSEDIGYVFGALVGNGWTSGAEDYVRQLHLAATDPGVIAEFRRAFAATFGNGVHIGHTEVRAAGDAGGYGPSSRMTVSWGALARVVAELIGRGARYKTLPSFFLAGNEAFRRGMVRGLMDTDGSVSFSNAKSKPQLLVSYSSASLRLVQEVQHLFRSVGVLATITPSKTPAGKPFWCLVISAPDFQRLDAKLKHTGKVEVLARAEPTSTTSGGYTRNHMLPITPSIVGWVRKQIKRATDSGLYDALSTAVKEHRITRRYAERAVELVPVDAVIPTGVQWEQFKAIVADEATVWDTVTGHTVTEMCETGYDLTVPGYETFMSVDGLILSNTVTLNVPLSDAAVKEVHEKLLPSRNLFSPASMKHLFAPNMEYQSGLHNMTHKEGSGLPVEFATLADARRAFMAGEIDYQTKIKITDQEDKK